MASKNTVAISLLAMFDQQSANKTTESFQKMIQEIGKMMRSQKISTKDFMDVRGNITDFKKFEKAIQDVGVSISGVMGKAKGDVTSFSTVMTKLNGSVNISNFAKNRFGEFEKESEVNSRKALPPVKQLNENYNNLIRAKKELNSLEKKGIVSGESYDKAIKNVERLKTVTQEYVDTLAKTYKLKISDSGMISGKGSIAQTQRRGQYESQNLDDNRRIIQAENQKQQEIKKTSTALSEYLNIRTKVSQMEAQGIASGVKYTAYKEVETGARPSNLEFDKDGALIANKKNADELGMSVQKLTANIAEYNRTMSLKKADIVSKQQSDNMRMYTSSLKEQYAEEVQLKKLQTSGVDKDIISKQQEAVTAITNRTNRLKGLVQGTEEYKKAEEELTIAEKKHNSAMEQVSDQTKKSTGLFANFATQFKQTFNTVVQAGLSWKVFSLMQQGLSKVAENVVELDKSLVNLQMATGGTKDETQKLLTTYTKMAQEIGSTTVEVADAADQWLRQGYSIQNTNKLVKDSMILSKIGQIDSADATQYLTSAMKGYKLSAEDAIGIVDKLSAVDLKSATSTAGLSLAMSRTANSADMMGISMDKLLGYLATIGEVTQKEMSSVKC